MGKLLRVSVIVLLMSFLATITHAADDKIPLMEAKVLAELPNIGVAGPLAGISNDALIIGGGANFPKGAPWLNPDNKKTYDQTLRVLLREKNGNHTWSDKTAQLPKPLGYSACVSDARGVICAGGENENGAVDDVLILTWNPQAQEIKITELPKLPAPRTNAVALIIPVKKELALFVIGGEIIDPATNKLIATDSVISLNLNKLDDGWRNEQPLPRPLSHAVGVLQSDGAKNCFYVLGGRAKIAPSPTTTFYNSVLTFFPTEKIKTEKAETIEEQRYHFNGTWLEKGGLTIAEDDNKVRNFAAGCASPLGMGAILIYGGDDGVTFNKIETLSGKIAATTGDEKTATEKELLELRTNHPGFSREIFAYNTITDKWFRVGDLPFTAPVTLPTLRWGSNEIIFPSGEIRPAVRTPQIWSLHFNSNPHFGWINYIVLGLYALGMLSLGFIFHDSKEVTTKQFFTGSGQLPWWVVGISIFATTLSAITFLSIPAKAFTTDWRMIFLNCGIFFVAPFIIWYYLPFFRRLTTESAYEYLETRFNRATRWLASAFFCSFMVARIAIVLYLPSLAINVITGINIYLSIAMTAIVTIIYCTIGGMKAVVWGDVIQGFILVIGAFVSLAYMINGTDGGVAGFIDRAYEGGRFHVLDLEFTWAQPVFWVVVLTGLANSLITYSSDQTIIQRYMSTETEKLAARGIWLNAFIAIPVTVLFFAIGTGLYTYYFSQPQLFDITLSSNDAIYPYFIVNSLPAGLSGVLVAAIFAAAMSTLSSNINSTSAAVVCDFVRVLSPNLSQKTLIRLGQTTGIVAGLAGMVMAMIMANWDIKSLWDQFNFYLGLLTGSLGGLFLLGIFFKRVNSFGAISGLAVSIIGLQIMKEYTNCSFLLYGFFGTMICCVVGYLSTFISANKKA